MTIFIGLQVLFAFQQDEEDSHLRGNYKPSICTHWNTSGQATGNGNNCIPSAGSHCLTGNACAINVIQVEIIKDLFN